MIEFIKSNKLLVATLLVIACGLVAYKVFFLSNNAPAPLTSSVANAGAIPASQSLLTVLTSLQTIHLDNAIFASQTFISLTDFGVEIQKQPAGRDNPFAPYVGIPRTFSSGTASSTASSTPPTILKLPLGKAK